MEQAQDITSKYETELKKAFRASRMTVEGMLALSYENGQRELFVTVKSGSGRCMTAKDGAKLVGRRHGRGLAPVQRQQGGHHAPAVYLPFPGRGSLPDGIWRRGASTDRRDDVGRQLLFYREPARSGDHQPVGRGWEAGRRRRKKASGW